VNKIKDFLLNLIFPKECVICGYEDTWLCPDCYQKIILVKSPTCPFCKRLTSKGEFCPTCRRKATLTGIMIAAYYETPLKEIIHNYKYKMVKDLSEPLADLLINHLQKFALPSNPLILPVPLHQKRLKEREFNQAALLGKKIADIFGLDFDDELMIRKINTKPQINLSGLERKENVKNAFLCINPQKVYKRNIILVDDVCTTGATLEACGVELRKYNARQIWGLVLARQ